MTDTVAETAAVATARTMLKEAVDAGAFREPIPLKRTLLSIELVPPLAPELAAQLEDLKDGERPDPDLERQLLSSPSYDDERAKTVIAKAMDGDLEADGILREIALEKLQEGLPPNLAAYISSILADGRSRSGRQGARQRYYARDAWICLAVEEINNLGFDVTRNSTTTEAMSASSIVAKALTELGVTLSEKSIERIWNDCPH